jgi:RNase P/RNase MRP subunit p29
MHVVDAREVPRIPIAARTVLETILLGVQTRLLQSSNTAVIGQAGPVITT